MEVGGWVQVSLGIFFVLENRPKIATKKIWMVSGWVGGIQVFFCFLIFLTL